MRLALLQWLSWRKFYQHTARYRGRLARGSHVTRIILRHQLDDPARAWGVTSLFKYTGLKRLLTRVKANVDLDIPDLRPMPFQSAAGEPLGVVIDKQLAARFNLALPDLPPLRQEAEHRLTYLGLGGFGG